MYTNLDHEDPFLTDELPALDYDFPFEGDGPSNTRFNTTRGRSNTYSTSQPGPSSISLIPQSYRSVSGDSQTLDDTREDDEARLTSNMVRQGSGGDWGKQFDENVDPERIGETTPRTKRKTVRYTPSPSPLKRTGSTLRTVSRNLRRVSLRVVNLAGMGLEDHVRLSDGDGEYSKSGKERAEVEEDTKDDELETLDLSQALPLRGHALGFLGPTNSVRLTMFRFLVSPWTEPTILILIMFNTVVLTIQTSRTLTLPTSPSDGSPDPIHSKGYFHTWEDYALFVLFIIFTLEAFARICVSGFLLDPEVPTSSLFTSPFASYTDPAIPPSSSANSTSMSSLTNLQPQPSLRRGRSITQRLRRIHSNLMRPFTLAPSHPYPHTRIRSDTVQSSSTSVPIVLEKAQQLHAQIRDPSNPSFISKILPSDQTKPETLSLPFRLNVSQVHDRTKRNLPYLRQSWGRIDFVAVVGFWISFGLACSGVERGSHHIGLFRALSVLRTARLLAITSGTTTIMRSLKTARPLLAGVAYFVVFAIIFFSIVGVQTFAGSYRRSCYLQATLGEAEMSLGQTCGSYVDPTTFQIVGYVNKSGGVGKAKGYVCPLGQICKEIDNPNGDFSSFDTIFTSALQVVIVASANGWSPIMYQMIDSEYFASCFFFIVCIVVLNFWLINLFVAVITNTFSAIRANTKKSAFGAAPLGTIVSEQDEDWAMVDGRHISRQNRLKEIYRSIRWCWVALALASLILQGTRTTAPGEMHQSILDYGELALTLVFDVEIFIRILAELPDWRNFFLNGRNWLDTILAIGSSIIQIPAVHNSAVYPWLTIFQLLRFYRVILEIPRMKPLLLAVFGNMYGLANMSLFLILINFIAALVAVQVLRGDMASSQPMNFGQVFTSFLAMYQVFSSENWTTVLFSAVNAEISFGQSALIALFVTVWLLFANFIVLQMFIAVINENFDVAEESKRGKQATNYWAMQQPEKARATWTRRFNPYRWLRASPKTIKVENLPSHLVLPMQKALVQDHTIPIQHIRSTPNLFVGAPEPQDVPLATIRSAKRQSVGPQDPNDEETDRHLELLATINPETSTAEGLNEALFERRAQKADFIRDHPSYDKTFWIFSQKNPIRQICQMLVQPSNGDRIFGIPPSPIAHPIFQLTILLTVIGGIVVEAIATPMYRRQFYLEHGLVRGSWFDIAETTLGLILFVEFMIKIVADGLTFTPNSYIRSIWNILDLIVLSGILVNIVTGLIFIGGLSRITRSLKALRALRLITLIEKMRSTFQSLIISGAARILDAAILAILYMIPYAIWGLNIFAGLMQTCNDTSVNGAGDCNYEFVNTVYGSSFGFPVPRVWDNPSPSTTFSFDTFRASLLILFETVSLEGWIDVLNFATSITGRGLQPQTNASQFYAIFFLIYNLLGGVVILTLFVSIIIGNFRSKTGAALLTQPQREWIDLQKLIKRQKPSKRPKVMPSSAIRSWCYERAVHKHGWWSRMMTFLFILHIFALMTQTFAPQHAADTLRIYWFLFISVAYVIDTSIRLLGLGFYSFRANGWNLFDMVVALGSFVTVFAVRFGDPPDWIDQLQRLFIVSLAFKLVQRTDSLNKLFKTAVASLPVILSLLGLWLILFLFFGILFLEVFSMTKWNSMENWNQNYSTMGTALVMLAFMTTGEGWNQYMHDHAMAYPRCTKPTPSDGDTDCGSVAWAFSLFIAWNLLSMYIFVNMFTGVVVESFSYVFQTTGGATSISREEMRAFKKVWAQFANKKTGLLERNQFVLFFAKLSGVFEVRIYPAEFSIPSVFAASIVTGMEGHQQANKAGQAVDVSKLNTVLNRIDYTAVRKRRLLYSRLYHEAMLFHEKGRGMSFNNMLLLLAHHKLIDDREALVLHDLVIRTEQNRLVSDLVNVDRVQSMLKMITLRRRFLAHREELRLRRMEQQELPDIPAIVVDGLPPTPPPMVTDDVTSARRDSMNPFSDSRSPIHSPSLSPRHSPDVSLSLDSGASLQRSRRISDISMLSTDPSYRYSFVSLFPF
ncbi:hypothetical protein JAAARDRAFT_69375 [Jaapia argillacea MUCL 33604]|uniref:Calcium-channel protein CCH1 n=1 Tax=Jaapia argillacea MUCL 33604 TaxID=933084 RepID=A0A067Q3L6_9AGAM|nr:hypothetical protein JAAARDRAFT_69375 [Jaapia argillacea MUCL 33604]